MKNLVCFACLAAFLFATNAYAAQRCVDSQGNAIKCPKPTKTGTGTTTTQGATKN